MSSIQSAGKKAVKGKKSSNLNEKISLISNDNESTKVQDVVTGMYDTNMFVNLIDNIAVEPSRQLEEEEKDEETVKVEAEYEEALLKEMFDMCAIEPIPLFPQNRSHANPDTTPVLREAFQDIFQKPPFPHNVARNIMSCKTDNEELKFCGNEINKAQNTMQFDMDTVEMVEKELMRTKAQYLSAKQKKASNLLCNLTNISQNYPSIKKQFINQYSLLSPNDLLPPKHEMLIGEPINVLLRVSRTEEVPVKSPVREVRVGEAKECLELVCDWFQCT